MSGDPPQFAQRLAIFWDVLEHVADEYQIERCVGERQRGHVGLHLRTIGFQVGRRVVEVRAAREVAGDIRLRREVQDPCGTVQPPLFAQEENQNAVTGTRTAPWAGRFGLAPPLSVEGAEPPVAARARPFPSEPVR